MLKKIEMTRSLIALATLGLLLSTGARADNSQDYSKSYNRKAVQFHLEDDAKDFSCAEQLQKNFEGTLQGLRSYDREIVLSKIDSVKIREAKKKFLFVGDQNSKAQYEYDEMSSEDIRKAKKKKKPVIQGRLLLTFNEEKVEEKVWNGKKLVKKVHYECDDEGARKQLGDIVADILNKPRLDEVIAEVVVLNKVEKSQPREWESQKTADVHVKHVEKKVEYSVPSTQVPVDQAPVYYSHPEDEATRDWSKPAAGAF